LAWTTTPWTLVSNMLLVVNPKLDYVLIRLKDTETPTHLILAEGLLGSVIKEEYEVLMHIKVSDLVGKTYRPIFDYALRKFDKSEDWRVVPADFVSIEDGTGIVHAAPAFGADDYDTAIREGVQMFNPIDRDGCFDESIT